LCLSRRFAYSFKDRLLYVLKLTEMKWCQCKSIQIIPVYVSVKVYR
jgi:hypothetical protein